MTTKISSNNYNELLQKLRQEIDVVQNNITRQKVVMAWQIGKLLDGHLAQNTQAGYGDKLFLQLEDDIQISQSVLYKMRSFYQKYSQLPTDDDKLNWSHYRILSGIQKNQDRKYLENLARENEWSSEVLQAETKQSKISQIRSKSKERVKSLPKKLLPKRGQLFSYPLIKQGAAEEIYIDCGFNIFRKVEEKLSSSLKSGDQFVQSFAENGEYVFKKLPNVKSKINIYKAELERVVDGDTLHVILDLGFNLTHREILRLRGIDAPEMSTAQGKRSAQSLKKILKNVPFLIVKTTSTDIYGRYVCDVFFAQELENLTPQEVADGGVYLNQMLLDKKLAVLF